MIQPSISRHALFALSLAAVLLAGGAAARRALLAEQQRGGALMTDSQLAARNRNAFAVILGEIRVTAADMIFTKTDRYLHAGVAYVQGVDLDKAAETHRHESQETPYGASETDPFSATAPVEPDHGGHEHEDAGGSALAHAHADADEEDLFAEHQGMPTVIRAAKDDFRGFLGDLERAVKPYQDASAPHHHTAGTELLPWYRLMALADPHNVRAYVVASMWLSQAGKWDEAEAFLLEGIQANPDNPERFRLHVALATLYVKSRHEAVWGGRDWAALALAQAQAAWRQAAAERPEGGRIGEARGGLVWLETHEEDFLFAGRYRILLLRQAGRLGEALAASEELQRLAPDDEPNRRTLDELRKQAATP